MLTPAFRKEYVYIHTCISFKNTWGVLKYLTWRRILWGGKIPVLTLYNH